MAIVEDRGKDEIDIQEYIDSIKKKDDTLYTEDDLRKFGEKIKEAIQNKK